MSKDEPSQARVLCTYVLNVCEDRIDRAVCIASLLEKAGVPHGGDPKGNIFITIRNDIKKTGPTTRGYQVTCAEVEEQLNLATLIRTTSSYKIYQL